MEEKCYTNDILYSSHIKNAEKIAMRYQEIIPWISYHTEQCIN